MNQFLERLPWRIAALGGLLVGGISLATGTDVWLCLMRAGAAFLVFGAFGLGLRAIMLLGSASVSRHAPGRHFDQTTPEENVSPPNGHNDAP